MLLDNSIVYDIEAYPNVFTLDMEMLHGDTRATWEISHFRDDRKALLEWFNWLAATQTPMIGFNNINYDYPMIHFIMMNPNCTVEQIREKNDSIINSKDRFGHLIWERDRFAPQIDLFKINHFDNMAKSTSLKALQVNMRLPNVVESSVGFDEILTVEQVDNDVISYNIHDVKSTKEFAHHNMQAMEFRTSLIEQFGADVMNWPDTKIGSRMMEAKLGKELCYDYSTGKKKTRQTPRSRIALDEIIFPYIQFQNPEFQQILDYMKQQVLTSDDLKVVGEVPKVQTKGVFKGLSAHVGGVDFHFGTGGIHGSVERQRLVATEDHLLHDIDVKGMYPNIAIVNMLAPEHLGEYFTNAYADLPQERERLQALHGKKSVEANSVKLAGNSVYGNSNNMYSPFYDPKFTLTITINGQLMLAMLIEALLNVPTLNVFYGNTDGITYSVHRDHEPHAKQLCAQWEALTSLVLEDVSYSRMWIRDVNNFIAEDMDGGLKLKGAYWTPDPLDYHNSISQAQPPAWHKDLGNCVSTRAAVASMVHGVDPETFIRLTTNPYDFMCRQKTRRADELWWGDERAQRTTRYYISDTGAELIKQSPPKGVEGAWKKANGVTQYEYDQVMMAGGGQWDELVCTKNKSKYSTRKTNLQSGYVVSLCNDVQDFDFNNVNYEWYINEARKLVI